MLDELLQRKATRIPSESPVPMVVTKDWNNVQGFPRGAGNVAANLPALVRSLCPLARSEMMKVECGS
jgi:bifunctional ADP-heptose synthase (sugar kinase/adenylyltransferase)